MYCTFFISCLIVSRRTLTASITSIISKLYQQTEKKEQLKVVPKLTASHVDPGKLEKMNVRLATQVCCFCL